MKFATATFLALVAFVSAKKSKHSECGMGAAHHHNHHSASSAVHSATISFSSIGGIHTSVAASSSVSVASSASASSAIASSASSTRSTVKVTSTVTASSSIASATSNIAIASSVVVASPSHASTRSTVKVTSTVTASSTQAASTTPKASTTKITSTTKSATSTKPSTSSTPTATVSTGSSGSGSNKRGLGFNAISATLPFSGAVSWAYNWDSQHSGSLASGTQFVPMLWGTANDHTAQWTKNAQAAIASGATHLLGFNEPDLGSQSNLSPAAAAAAWKKYMQPFVGQAKLVSPAVTNGGAPMGTAWLEDFIDECDGCTIDAVAIHIYDSASNVAYFKSYIEGVGKKFGKPVWVTEFGASGSVDAQSAFLKEMVPFLNGLASVERFAYFGDFEGTFVQNGKLLPLGKAYATA